MKFVFLVLILSIFLQSSFQSFNPLQRFQNIRHVSGRIKRQSILTGPERDIIILMDESGSLGLFAFDRIKRLAASIVKLLCGDRRITPSKTRIGITSFDSVVHPHIDLLEMGSRQVLNNNAEAIAQEIMSIRNNQTTSGRTCIYDALEYTHTISFSSSRGGRRNNPGVEQEIYIITDGCANCGGNLVQMRDTLVNAGTSVYVIGVEVSSTCQENIRILAQGGKCYHFFFMDIWGENFDDLIQSIYDQAELPEDDRAWCISQLYHSSQNCP